MKKGSLKKAACVLGIIFWLGAPLFQAESASVSETAPAFLTMLIQPRPAGLAGAYTALADDLDSLFYNPAGLACLRRASLAVSYRTGIQDMGFGSAAFSYPASKQGVLGAAFLFQNQGDMEIFREDGNIENKGLSGSFSFSLSAAFALPGEALGIGSTVKFIQENLADYSASTMAFDLGVRYETGLFKKSGKRLTAGLALQNAGSGLRHVNQSEPLPLLFRTGLAFHHPAVFRAPAARLSAALDMEWEKGRDAPALASGLELLFRNTVFLRSGYALPLDGRGGEQSGFSAGLGIRTGPFRIDYALRLTDSILVSALHSFGAVYSF